MESTQNLTHDQYQGISATISVMERVLGSVPGGGGGTMLTQRREPPKRFVVTHTTEFSPFTFIYASRESLLYSTFNHLHDVPLGCTFQKARVEKSGEGE